jgi:hypothetical protein
MEEERESQLSRIQDILEKSNERYDEKNNETVQ